MAANRIKILAILGSTRKQSTNQAILDWLKSDNEHHFEFIDAMDICAMPHFNPDVEQQQLPTEVEVFRQSIAAADAVVICTPEYIFGLPGSLKNALEWTVGSTVFEQKPTALITASALGEHAHASLQLIMRTMSANFTTETQLLISGVRAKFDERGELSDAATLSRLRLLSNNLADLVQKR